jgi:hypothetical protein
METVVSATRRVPASCASRGASAGANGRITSLSVCKTGCVRGFAVPWGLTDLRTDDNQRMVFISFRRFAG